MDALLRTSGTRELWKKRLGRLDASVRLQPAGLALSMSNHAGLFRRLKKGILCDMPILPSQASPTMPSLLLPALVITSTCLFPAAHATLPLDDPALAEDLKAYIASLDPTKPEDCIGFVNRHLSDILYTRFTHKSVLEDELARMKSTHATACLRNKTLKGISKEEILRLEAAERASPWWERSGWATRDKQSLLRLPPDAIKDAVPDGDPALAANPQPIESASEPETHSASAGPAPSEAPVAAPAASCDPLQDAGWCDLSAPRS